MVMPSLSSSTAHNGSAKSGMPNPEVVEKAQRRIYAAEYKLEILQETDSCSEGQIGAILRREGLYSSQVYPYQSLKCRGRTVAAGE
jgi:transposase